MQPHLGQTYCFFSMKKSSFNYEYFELFVCKTVFAVYFIAVYYIIESRTVRCQYRRQKFGAAKYFLLPTAGKSVIIKTTKRRFFLAERWAVEIGREPKTAEGGCNL